MTANARGPIVVGLDGSPSAKFALEWAVAAAQRRHRGLRLVQATDMSSPWGGRHDGRPLLDRPSAADEHEVALSAVTAAVLDLQDVDVEIESYVGTGRPVGILLEESQHAHMVVVGSRGHSVLLGLLLGSTSLQVATHAACPVVVVRPPADRVTPGPSAGRVVVGIDGSAASDAAIAFAFEEADSRRVGLTAVHAWRWPDVTLSGRRPLDPDGAAGDEERALLSERITPWADKHPNVGVVQLTVPTDAASALVAESAGAALTVIGSRGAGGFAGLMLGSVTHALLHHAVSPVAVVRGQDSR